MILRFHTDDDQRLWLKVAAMGWDNGECHGSVDTGCFALFLPLRRRWWFGLNDPAAAIFRGDGRLITVERFQEIEIARTAWDRLLAELPAHATPTDA